MRLVERRVLDGPNVFHLAPAIKIEVETEGDETFDQVLERLRDHATLIASVHQRFGLPAPDTAVEPLESPGHFALAFTWNRRAFATCLADGVAESLTSSGEFAQAVVACRAHLDHDPAPEDRPEMITDADRSKLTIAVTGTNGKTTTTRLIAHMFAQAGRRVGWSCSSGVYIAGEEVFSGDYSGMRGAQRVLQDPGVEVAVLETARGGILLRGIACESVDVSVFTNISGDHLGLHGIWTVEGLARVKSVVSAVTRPDGYAVLNADDPLVMGSTRHIRAHRFLVSRQPETDHLQRHIAGGGRAIVCSGGLMLLYEHGQPIPILDAADAPMTYRGTAGFMIENAMCGAAAAYAGGLTLDQVREGLRTFDNSPDRNLGRLNVYDLDGVTVVVDFAHNEAGLLVLLDFARSLAGDSGRIISIIGTAGDRTDESLRELGRIAAAWSDHVIAKHTKKYLRGRDPDELMALYADGARQHPHTPYSEAGGELAAVEMALGLAQPGDAIAVMAQEETEAILSHLTERGARLV